MAFITVATVQEAADPGQEPLLLYKAHAHRHRPGLNFTAYTTLCLWMCVWDHCQYSVPCGGPDSGAWT